MIEVATFHGRRFVAPLNAATLTVDDPRKIQDKQEKEDATEIYHKISSKFKPLHSKQKFDRFVSWVVKQNLDPKKISQLSNKNCRLQKPFPPKRCQLAPLGPVTFSTSSRLLFKRCKRRPVDTIFCPTMWCQDVIHVCCRFFWLGIHERKNPPNKHDLHFKEKQHWIVML